MKKSSRLFESLLVAALCVAMTSSIAWCASGDLDPSFGNGGKLLLPDGSLQAVQFDSNTGAIDSVGSRENKQLLISTISGHLDSSFGHGGVVVNSSTNSGAGLVILPDSRIVTAGSARTRISLSRYEANEQELAIYSANAAGTGTIVASGYSISSDEIHAAMARYLQ